MADNDLKPNYSSSEDESEEPSGTEDEHSSDTESDQPPNSPQNPQKTLISPESEQSGSGTDSDSDSPAVADPNIKPIRSIPMEPEELGQKSELLPAQARSKRPAVCSPATVNEKEAKKPKSNHSIEEESKKQLFQRLWSEDDEIVILKGMIDYKGESGENNGNVIGDTGAFHEFIKKSLHVDVSRAQLVDKIRRLKKKYVNNVSKEKDGKDRSFSKSHEQRGFELSKLIWGGSNNSNNNIEGKKNKGQKNGNVASASANGLDDDHDKEGFVLEGEKGLDISRFVRYGGRNESPVLPEEIVKAGMELAEGAKRVELEERWRSLKKEELEIYLRKMELVKEQALVVLEAVNTSGS
ncbi:putative transcription factor GeBP family [Helianthus annuus]|uniref:Putative DNA-binding storekeeper protein-related transcriptional regulator n=1 Tax=Helianthus annuus TaxID=4232 RepID=A0A251VPH8_HELAN|nr:probable transcription factor At1g11510 [Helianthus annuus]KAF5822610.1 putative transcription factor GeBP family [Helianthus annuus]